ncbi:unnamed protein product [Larinioides sclopetarius]|uniref:Uncharacterized protein n=1 Tax=Larinioides sclopetarius TaxID=280406 RepID=A0AAV2ATV1_9ARAC
MKKREKRIYHKLLKNCQKRTWRNRFTRRRRTASNSETGRNSSENGYELQALNQGEPSDSMWSYMNDVTTKNEIINNYVETTNKYSETATKYAVDDIDFAAPFHVLRRSKSLNDIESVMYR